MNREKLKAKLVEAFRERRQPRGGWSPKNVANVAIGFDCGHVHASGNTACHAGLNGIRFALEQPKGKAVLILSTIQDPSRTKIEDSKRVPFLHWLFNESLYRSVFVTKDAEQAVKDGYFFCNTTEANNLLVGGLIASRIASEHVDSLRAWNLLVKHGLHRALAYGCCLSFSATGDNLSFSQKMGHCPYDAPAIGKKSLNAIRDGKVPNPKGLGKPYRETLRYGHISDLMMSPGEAGGLVKQVARKTCSDSGKKTNPFATAQSSTVIKSEDIPKFINELRKALR